MSNYFSKLPKSFYSLDDSVNVVTNITSRFSFEKQLKDNLSSYYIYEIEDGDTPESIAHKAYGSADRHWIILLFNDILDSQFDWPLKYRDFINYVEKKYSKIQNVSIVSGGTGYSNGFVKFETSDKVGTKANAYFTVNTSTGSIETIRLLNSGSGYMVQPDLTFSSNGTGANILVELIEDPLEWTKNNIKSYYKVETQITSDEIMSQKKYEISQNTYTNLSEEVTTLNIFDKLITIKTTKETKNYYDYEIEENEKKRSIKILRPEFVNAVEDELRRLFND